MIDQLPSDGAVDYLAWVDRLIHEGETCPICMSRQSTEKFHIIHEGRGAKKSKPTSRAFTVIPTCSIDHTRHHNEGLGKHYGKVDLWKILAGYHVRYIQGLIGE